MGQLRAPLEGEHIITQRDEGTNQYRPNRFWLDQLDVPIWLEEPVNTLLANFSSTFDRIPKDFADSELQIKTPDKPNGLFSYSVLDIDLVRLTADVQADSAFAAFIDQCIDIFWANLEVSLENVRDAISTGLSEKALNATSTLVRELEGLRGYEANLDELISAVKRAQMKLYLALTDLQRWFFAPKAVESKFFTIDEIVDISIKQICRLHPNFQPAIESDISLSLPILDFRHLADMFFIIFDNIQEHAGTERPLINVRVALEEDRLIIEVVSEFNSKEDLEPRLSKIREIIAGGRYQHIVKSEGGTGLVKLWNLIRNGEPGSPNVGRLEFGPVDGRFRVNLNLPFTVIRP